MHVYVLLCPYLDYRDPTCDLLETLPSLEVQLAANLSPVTLPNPLSRLSSQVCSALKRSGGMGAHMDDWVLTCQ